MAGREIIINPLLIIDFQYIRITPKEGGLQRGRPAICDRLAKMVKQLFFARPYDFVLAIGNDRTNENIFGSLTVFVEPPFNKILS